MSLKAGSKTETTPGVDPYADSMAQAIENAFLKEWPVIMGKEKPAPEGNDQMRLMFIAIAQGVVRHLLDNESAITVNTRDGSVAVQITTTGNLY